MDSRPLRIEVASSHAPEDWPKLILSVDNEPQALYTRYKILAQAGYDVLSAVDGECALNMFTELPVDLVLLDYSMPGTDGGMVAREMKRRKRHVPVIFVSASYIPKESLACADSFVDKGDGPTLLLEAIRKLFVSPIRKSPSVDGRRGKHGRSKAS